MKRFTIVQNGYNVEEVNRFIDIVIKRLEKLNNDNSLLQVKISSLEEQLKEKKVEEVKLSEAILAAQQTSDRIKTLAREEANMIVEQAKNYKRREAVGARLENWARARHTYLAAGHTHRPSLTFSEKEGWGYFNTGSCVHPNTITCMELIYGQLSLVKWTLCADENSYLKVCRHIVAGPKSLF